MVAEAHTVNHCALLVLPVMVTRNVPLSSGWKCFHDFQGLKVRIWSSGNWKVWVQNNATIICACVTLPNPWLHLFPCHPEDSIPQYRQGQGGQRGSTARLRDLLRYSCDGTGGSPDLTWISSAWLLSHSQKMVRGQMKPSWLKLPLSKFLWGQLALFCTPVHSLKHCLPLPTAGVVWMVQGHSAIATAMEMNFLFPRLVSFFHFTLREWSFHLR